MREFIPSDVDIKRAYKYAGGVKIDIEGMDVETTYLVLSREDLEEMLDLLEEQPNEDNT